MGRDDAHDPDDESAGDEPSPAEADDDHARAAEADDEPTDDEPRTAAAADESVGDDAPPAVARDLASVSGPPRSGRLWLAGALLVAVIAIDLVTKAWAWDNLREGATVTVVDGWLYFEFGFNTGSAFSLLRDASWARAAFIGVTIAAVGYMVRLALTLPTRWASAYVAIALVAGGALGNLHDRLVRTMEVRGELRHGVVDFIKVYYWPDHVWPTFNVADIGLVVGVGLLLLFLTRHGDVLDAQAAARKQHEGRRTPAP